MNSSEICNRVKLIVIMLIHRVLHRLLSCIIFAARPSRQGSLHRQGAPRRVREELENRKGEVEKGLYTFSSITH